MNNEQYKIERQKWYAYLYCSLFIERSGIHCLLFIEKRFLEIKESILSEKSLEFAAQTVKFCIKINAETKENIITKQLIRSSTSVGANINEANYGVSRADFIAKMHIAMKEASESEYWLKLLYKAEYVKENDVIALIEKCRELERMLISTLKTAKENRN